MQPMFSKLVVLTITMLLTACASTTGNPNKGGLFQWNEDKAKERQHYINQEIDDTDYETDKQERGIDKNLETKKNLQIVHKKLINDFQLLTNENTDLINKIADLIVKRKKSKQDLENIENRFETLKKQSKIKFIPRVFNEQDDNFSRRNFNLQLEKVNEEMTDIVIYLLET